MVWVKVGFLMKALCERAPVGLAPPTLFSALKAAVFSSDASSSPKNDMQKPIPSRAIREEGLSRLPFII
jgi:hypothetical protein